MTALTALILTISFVGLVLVAILYVRLREVDRTLQLKRHRAQDEALCDLLNYAAVVDDGVVIGKNGALIAGWEYTGADNASVTDHGARCCVGAVKPSARALGHRVDAARRRSPLSGKPV